MPEVRFLLGPAGSGKTHRCLAEIRAELAARPQGPPLLLLSPKQATFQLERQLLDPAPPDSPALDGFARLEILSFERLAHFVLDRFSSAPPRLLSEEGRIMVLRALLASHHQELQRLHRTARLPGFAQELSQLLRELQHHQVRPARLAELAEHPDAPAPLRAKLHDLALLLDLYRQTLARHRLEDADHLPDLAAETLRHAWRADPGHARFGGLWLDGFAEMTAQELDLLATLVPHCARATLAFCLEGPPQDQPSWLSTWALIAQTYRACHQRLAGLPDTTLRLETLSRHPAPSRFPPQSALAHLEANWTTEQPFPDPPAGLQLIQASHPEAEALAAAHLVLEHARAGGRYREAAVLVRHLSTHAVFLRRIFTRFGIPFFLDQREPVAHHPLAELTRSALRLAAYQWQHEDWFGALKSGLVHPGDHAIDQLENEALARGWNGLDWLAPLRFDPPADYAPAIERLRLELVPPFLAFRQALAAHPNPSDAQPNGSQLASALRQLWTDLEVPATLRRWAEENPESGARRHLTVWQQMQDWLENVTLAFEHDSLPLPEWLPILETGLASLSVGVIPPALDQVLIGAIDRSRNPDLRLAIILGLNEGLFPAPPPTPTMLTEAETATLEQHGLSLGIRPRLRLAHERFYGYIACTRARERLALTCATTDADGQPLNPSPLLHHLQRLFPALSATTPDAIRHWSQAAHPAELGAAWLQPHSPLTLADRAEDGSLLPDSPFVVLEQPLAHLRAFRLETTLSPATAGRLYGNPFRTSVSNLEQFGMCPFRFFVRAGLRAQERQLFQVDPRELGNFQHEVLRLFHEQLVAESRLWRSVTPEEARQRIEAIAQEVAAQLRGGLFRANAPNRFTTQALTRALQEFIAAVIAWMPQYEFDPVAVELPFGMESDGLPAWTLPLDHGRQLAFRGRIDRVDLGPATAEGSRWVVVHDYKSSGRQFDPLLLANGIQLQLPAYLAALLAIPEAPARLGVEALRPAGVFYLNLRGQISSAPRRDEALADADRTRQLAYRHLGRFDLEALPHLDNRKAPKGDQFQYAYRQDGQLYQRCQDPMPGAQFHDLLRQVEAQLRTLGQKALDGQAAVDPYLHRRERPCDHCDYAAICRIDPWTHAYRPLAAP